MPASSRIVMLGSPSPAQIAPSAPGPSDDSDEMIIPVSNIAWSTGTSDRAREISRASVSSARSGRSSRTFSACSFWMSRSGKAVTLSAHCIDAPSSAAWRSDSCHGSARYGGTSSRSSKKAWSMTSGVTPGIRAPSSRVSDSGL